MTRCDLLGVIAVVPVATLAALHFFSDDAFQRVHDVIGSQALIFLVAVSVLGIAALSIDGCFP